MAIPDSLIEIGRRAFAGCVSLRSIKLPSGLREISPGMFENCVWLEYVKLPDSLVSIGERAFAGANLNSIHIPCGVVSIGRDAFLDNRVLSSIVIPSSVEQISRDAFSGHINENLQIFLDRETTIDIEQFPPRIQQRIVFRD